MRGRSRAPRAMTTCLVTGMGQWMGQDMGMGRGTGALTHPAPGLGLGLGPAPFTGRVR